MFNNYLKIAFRNLWKNKGYSAINIVGLSVGMAVAVLIGLWVFDELSFNKYHKNYDRLGQVWQFVKFDVEKSAYNVAPVPLAEELRSKYPDFEKVSLSGFKSAILSAGEKKFEQTGQYVEPDFIGMMGVKIVAGTGSNFADINSILLSESLARSFFGAENPLNRMIRINNKEEVKVAGIYEDMPSSSSFKEASFLAPWKLLVSMDNYARSASTQWDENSFQVYVQLKEGADFGKVSSKIKETRMKRDDPPAYHPEFFIHPMSSWHLYSDFQNGINTGGMITFVWLFGTIGVFVLLLACINFMNLSTARSEKRAKEVGIRKAIGSLRQQLISQFFCESFLVVFIAFSISILLVALSLPMFNQVAEKEITLPVANLRFWIAGLGFSAITALISGSYPAFYLSSFQPLKVLKGTFRVGKLALIPRKVLVVLQFTVSVTLIAGTIIVFRQIEFAKDRPVGYNREGLIEVEMSTPDLYNHYNALKNELLGSGAVSAFSESSGSLTVQYGGTTNISWAGKASGSQPLIMSNSVTHDYGKTVGWKLKAGRDFSRDFSTDSSAIILNETAAKLMGFKKPLEAVVKLNGREFRVIGVIENMIKESPFSEVSPSFFVINYTGVNMINMRLSGTLGISQSLARIENVFKKFSPGSPFEYRFVDKEFLKKFGEEERIARLASFFTLLAIFISCLGLFGLSSFVAEQRTKEIGVRKVLGASVANLWQLLSRDFVFLVMLSCLISCPIAGYFMESWLDHYTYREPISWWVFGLTGCGALLITLLTVSYQAIKAALVDPVRSLRSE
ncbi:ABC transporter permease [Dyadobacter sp. Leaf189]|uniref:ABC transporter permease n=1 Tax=Dyadobacter sp. Leaf189 TaxID=1736295 RepID=UPI0006FDC778|nr:ABC transporter permease [Dyadobacter sp. Leaf189]KQS33512.1 ABC transporter permease [Dyadobacter sp. Leaf189]